MSRVSTDDTNHAVATNDFAFAAHALDRCLNFHLSSPEKIRLNVQLLGSKHDPALGQVVRRELHRHLVAGQNADVVHTHLPGDMTKHRVPVFEFYLERRIGEVFNHLPLHLNNIFF